MAVRPIRFYPDPVLAKVAQDVTEFDDNLRLLVDDMLDTMYHAKGVGLAAPQIGVSKQVSVIDEVGDKKNQTILINPKIIETANPTMMEEGCLSFPGVYEKVERFRYVKVEAQDMDGKKFTLESDSFLAHAFQHEIDHLNGKLFIEYLSALKRNRAKKKLEKVKKQHGLK